MLSGLIVATLGLIGTILFNSAFAFSNVQTAYLGLYKGIVERNVLVTNDQGEYSGTPYFDLNGLREDLGLYFQSDLKPYCRDYDYVVTGASHNEYGYIDAVKIKLDVQITLTWQKDYTAVFAITRRN